MTRATVRLTTLAATLALAVASVTAVPAAAGEAVTRVPSAESYALRLLNCTRTGGWVMEDGSCADRASGQHSAYRRPLRLHKGVSVKVAWPWARSMVINDVCGHSIADLPDLTQRLRSRGFSLRRYGENVGCGWGARDVNAIVLMTHLAMQDEMSTGGGHWVNIKNPGYKSVGIGVATGAGRTMVVWDFYGQRY